MSTNTNGVKARVMLVEDNQNLRSVLKEYFEALRYSVDDFNNGITAAASFSRNKYFYFFYFFHSISFTYYFIL